MRTLWSHGEERPAEVLAEEWGASFAFDVRLLPYDVRGSIAHARMLGATGIIAPDEAARIIAGLEEILREWEVSPEAPVSEYEDVHTYVEARLTEKIGDTARKLHTARSRNDQVALDLRLFTRQAIKDSLARIKELQWALVNLAEANKAVIMPGYTHMQRAQPVLLAHHLLAYFEMLRRDAERFAVALKRVNIMPLGSGALAGVAYNIDRQMVARELGFDAVSRNSIDAVADRDFVIDYEAAAATCLMHLSRLAEEIALWSSSEFGFIELDDAYSTGSSIMPQKRNPDVAELARGKTGRVYGHLLAMLTLMKGLPLAYNRDLQEDKEGLFDTVDTLLATLEVFAGMLGTLRINGDKMRGAAGQGYMLATDLADYLVRKGAAFRTAHSVVAQLVSYAAENGKTLSELSLDEYRRFSPLFSDDVSSISPESSVAARSNPGGTAPEQVERALSEARQYLNG